MHESRLGTSRLALALPLTGAFAAMLLTAAMSAPGHSAATKGAIPDDAWGRDGGLNRALVPDFIAVWDRTGTSLAGYAPKELVLGTQAPRFVSESEPDLPVPVYGEDLNTVVGHLFPDKGFIPVGVDPESIPRAPAQASEAGADE